MTTINISLPKYLKAQALVDEGFYSSFSDLVRDELRKIIASYKYGLATNKYTKDVESRTTIHSKK